MDTFLPSLLWLAVISLPALIFVVLFVIQLPEGHFDAKSFRVSFSALSTSDKIKLILKNIFGLLILGLGILLLFLPGQGMITILIGIMLLDIPCMRSLEAKIIRQPKIFENVNRLRVYFRKKPFRIA